MHLYIFPFHKKPLPLSTKNALSLCILLNFKQFVLRGTGSSRLPGPHRETAAHDPKVSFLNLYFLSPALWGTTVAGKGRDRRSFSRATRLSQRTSGSSNSPGPHSPRRSGYRNCSGCWPGARWSSSSRSPLPGA